MSHTDLVIQTEELARAAAAWLARRCRLEVCASDDSRFYGFLAEASGLVVRTYTTVDEAMLDAAPRLRVVGRAGVGVDNIDVVACRARDVEVVYAPDANTQAVVEYVVSLLGPILRRSVALNEPIDLQRWRRLRADLASPRQMSETTLGVLGLGRIGKRVAEVAAAIGFERVLYNDLLEIPPAGRHGAAPVPVERLFSEADVISLHVDGRPGNRHFVGRHLIGLMRPHVILLNTSRGFVVDSSALAAFLRANTGALALLDVHEQEPFEAGYPLLGLANVRLYPHLAAATKLADLNMSWVVRDVATVLEGRPPRHPAPAPPC
jgi:phosphoglycerate dehydrogenase-like enzyme